MQKLNTRPPSTSAPCTERPSCAAPGRACCPRPWRMLEPLLSRRQMVQRTWGVFQFTSFFIVLDLYVSLAKWEMGACQCLVPAAGSGVPVVCQAPDLPPGVWESRSWGGGCHCPLPARGLCTAIAPEKLGVGRPQVRGFRNRLLYARPGVVAEHGTCRRYAVKGSTR